LIIDYCLLIIGERKDTGRGGFTPLAPGAQAAGAFYQPQISLIARKSIAMNLVLTDWEVLVLLATDFTDCTGKFSHEEAQKKQRKINHRFQRLTRICLTAEDADYAES